MMREKVLGPTNSYTAYSQNDLAIALQRQSKLEIRFDKTENPD